MIKGNTYPPLARKPEYWLSTMSSYFLQTKDDLKQIRSTYMIQFRLSNQICSKYLFNLYIYIYRKHLDQLYNFNNLLRGRSRMCFAEAPKEH